MAINKITEKQVAQSFASDAHVLVTQTATVSGSQIVDVVRVPASVFEESKNTMLQEENIPGTTQEITFDMYGNIRQINHVANNASVRTDVFTFETNTITEVRTLVSGESLTIVTDMTTLETTVEFSAA